MNRASRLTHRLAALIFTVMAAGSGWYGQMTGNSSLSVFSWLALLAAILAWLLYIRTRIREKREEGEACRAENLPGFPEGQAKLIDSGRLPNRYNPRVDLREYEICHFYVQAQRLILAPLPEGLHLDPTRLAVRYSGGNYYYIVRPQEILLPAQADEAIPGELVITNQRILFVASENGFEVPLQSLKMLDCSAHLVDFQVRSRRYTIQTDAACYAEKVLMLLLQPGT